VGLSGKRVFQNPTSDAFVESHPFDSAQGRLLRKKRARIDWIRAKARFDPVVLI
jgi:hypothetical protein